MQQNLELNLFCWFWSLPDAMMDPLRPYMIRLKNNQEHEFCSADHKMHVVAFMNGKLKTTILS
jgi:hypothetical protein